MGVSIGLQAIGIGIASLVLAPVVRRTYLRLHKWRYGHRPDYNTVSRLEFLAFQTHTREYDANLLALVSLSGSLTFIVVGLAIVSIRHDLLNLYGYTAMGLTLAFLFWLEFPLDKLKQHFQVF